MEKRRDDIDGLRALAVLPIVLYHLGVPAFGGGYVGVDVFFVISGYLITQKLAQGQALSDFYMRRARRILPGLLLMLLVTGVAALVLLMPRDLAAFGRSLVGALLFFSNVQFWSDVGYFDEAATLKPLLHTWSLAVEEQFYLFFPLFLILCRRYLRSVLVPLGGLAAISFALSALCMERWPSIVFYWLPFRAWELMIGAGLALWRPGPGGGLVAAMLGFALLVFAVFGYDESTSFPGLAALVPCVGTALLLHSGQSRFAAPLRSPVLMFYGRISYSLYLWHWPVIVFYRYLGYEPDMTSGVLLFAFTTAVAWLAWSFVEEPLRIRRAWPRVTVAGLASVTIGLASAGTLMLDGLPARFPQRVVALESAAGDRGSDPRGCHNRRPDQVLAGELCVIGDATKAPKWLLWGDSHGRVLQGVFDAALRINGESALVATRDGCIPLPGVARAGRPKCDRFGRAVQDFLKSRPLKVILVGHWTGYKDVRLSDGRPGTSEEVIARGLQRAHFSVVVDPVPGAPHPVPRALAQHVAYGTPAPPQFTRDAYLARNARFFEATQGRQHVSFWKELCAGGVCAIERDGRPLYFDSNHLAASTIGFAVPIVASALRNAAPATH